MPVYQYEGQHYDLPDGLTNEQALSKIKAHLGASDNTPTVSQTPAQSIPSTMDNVGTGIKQAFAGVGNTADTALSMLAGGAAGLVGDQEEQARIYKGMQEREAQRNQWANPNNVDVGGAGKLAGAVATLPMQLATFPLSPFTTGKTAVDTGATSGQALAAQGVDVAGNIVGSIVGPGKTIYQSIARQAGANAAQDYITKWVIQQIMSTEEGKKAFEPSLVDAAVSGIVGGGMGAVTHQAPTIKAGEAPKSAVMSKLDEIDSAKQPHESAPVDSNAEFYKQEALKKQHLAELQSQIDSIKRGQRPIEVNEQGTARAEGQRIAGQTPMERMASELGAGEKVEPASNEGPMGRVAAELTGNTEAIKQKLEELRIARDTERMQNANQSEMFEGYDHGYGPYPHDIGGQQHWTLDENGMPIRADLSMEAANLENPLQRNLWGDELAPKHEQEVFNTLPLGSAARRALMKKQGGMVNPAVFKEGFEKTKELANGVVLRATSDGQNLTIKATRNGEYVGGATFNRTSPTAHPMHTDIQAPMVGSRESGTATQMYRFASELGNDIVPSKKKTDAGVAMWNSFERKGLSRGGYIPKGQRGGVNVDALGKAYEAGKERLNDAVKAIASVRFNQDQAKADYFSKNIPAVRDAIDSKLKAPDSPEVSIQKALADGTSDTPSLWTNVQSGPGLAAAKFKNHPVLQAVSRNLNYGLKAGEYQARNLVHPLEKFLSTLPSKSLTDLHDVMRREMFNEKRYTPEELASAGLSKEQIDAYQMTRAAFDHALDIQNESRLKMGLDPIKPAEAYMASRWNGDWHTPVLDKNGKLAWYIRTTSEKEGKQALAYLKNKFGDELAISDKTAPEYRRGTTNPRVPSDVMGAYHDMLSFFNESPEISSQIKDAMQGYLESKGYAASGQSKHFLQKHNIRGFEGDRPWLSPTENAYQGMKSQVDYLNNAIKWSHTQESIANLKELLSNPDVVAKHPNATEFAKLTLARELGIDNNWFTAFENSLAKGLGLSRSSLYRGTADLKTMTYLQILGASPGYMLATPLQAVMTTPSWHRVLTSQGFKHNTFKTSLLATADTTAGIANHISHELGKEVQLPMTEFGRKALQYAEDSGIVSKNLFDESRGLGEHAALAKLQSGLGWTVGFPEKVARMGAFMSFAHHLEASGKYSGDQLGLFRHAEELTDNALTSFKSFDRPMIVERMGATGQMAYMFKSFLFNGFNQLSAFSRMAHEYASTGGKSGAVSPLLASVGMYALMGGIAGAPLVNEIDGLWNVIKDGVAKFMPEHYGDVEGKGIKGTLISLLPETSAFRDIAAYGLPSAALQVNLAPRMNLAAVDVEKPLQGLAPIAQEMKEWGGIGSAALHRNKDAVLSAIYANAPPLVKGQMETKFPEFKAGNTPGNQAYYSPDDLTNPTVQAHRRTKFDEGIRELGMVSLPEARDKEAQFLTKQEDQRKQTAEKELLTRIMSGIKRGDQADIKANAVALLKLNPDSKALDSMLNERVIALYTTPMEQRMMKNFTLNQIKSYQRYASMSK